MSYGTVSPGPGFISGSVLTGANKGTSGGAPVVGLKMCVVNSTSGQLIEATRTDATGHYTLANLAVGQTYYVFPDSLNYLTTPYTTITLTSSASSMTTAGFIQHTISKTITPVGEGVTKVDPLVSSVVAFPNPTSGNLFIQWHEKTAETATVTIADMAGRTVLNNKVEMNQGSGMKQLDLSGLANGSYVISITSASLNYTGKVQVVH